MTKKLRSLDKNTDTNKLAGISLNTATVKNDDPVDSKDDRPSEWKATGLQKNSGFLAAGKKDAAVANNQRLAVKKPSISEEIITTQSKLVKPKAKKQRQENHYNDRRLPEELLQKLGNKAEPSAKIKARNNNKKGSNQNDNIGRYSNADDERRKVLFVLSVSIMTCNLHKLLFRFV